MTDPVQAGLQVVAEAGRATEVEWSHFWLALLTALWGGAASYLRRLKSGASFSWLSASSHFCMSGFAGFICWLACSHLDISLPLTAAMSGIAGHMGVEFIKFIEDKWFPQDKNSSNSREED